MNQEFFKSTDASYQLAEQKAFQYFQTLQLLVSQKDYISSLTKDFQTWSRIHLHPFSLSTFFSRKQKPDPAEYHKYLQWLDHTGKLHHYLDRSISYIYMRDLGKALDSPKTQSRISHAVDSFKQYLTVSISAEQGEDIREFSLARLYRIAQKEDIESTLIWLIEKLKKVSSHIPEGMDAVQAQRKLIKIIAGVLMHVLEEIGDEIPSEERTYRLDQAIRLGYSYGLTYPFIDDLLDAKVLSEQEKKQYSDLIRDTLITGAVPVMGEWSGRNIGLMQFVYSELQEAFEYIKAHQRPENMAHFWGQSYVFFRSQEEDRVKNLSNPNYTNEELYLPVILKSSSSRLLARTVIDCAPEDEEFETLTFYYGIYNQLADDFTDMFDDVKNGAVTPYTYYLKYHDKRPDLVNPFELYWAVISNLIHHVYHSDAKTCEVLLDRAINGLKRLQIRVGMEKYNEVMELFAAGIPGFNRLIQKTVRKAEDVDFFDKLIRDHMIAVLKNESKEKDDFFTTIQHVREEINTILRIPKTENDSLIKGPIIDAANYSLEGSGKRLRPIITWVMGVREYGLKRTSMVPLLRSLEYMHTASLIFDDLPSQDNADIRRGRPTLHQVYNISIAELTGLFLIQKATEEQASLDQFDPKRVLSLIRYSAQTAEAMCKGQAMDLDSKGKPLTLEQLNTLSFYKTGIAFEASLLMPAILADKKEREKAALKKFACHAGIAFQIKDDLLDVEGDQLLLGKPTGEDAENNNSTFVTILGREGAKKEMWEHYCQGMEALQEVPGKNTFLRQLLQFIVNRDH